MFDRMIAFWSSLWNPSGSRAGLATPAEGDRRDLERHPRHLEVSCRLANNFTGARWPAVVQDVSAGGVGLLSDRAVEVNTLIEVTWPQPIKGVPSSVPVRVARTTAQAGGYWSLGCQFAPELTAAQMQSLLDTLR